MLDWLKSFAYWTPADARRRLLKGAAPARMRVDGRLNLQNVLALTSLPERLTAEMVNVSGCQNLRRLPTALACSTLILRQSGVERLPPGLQAYSRVDAEDCRRLRLVDAVSVDELILRNCTALETLAEGLRVRNLNVSRCPCLTVIPRSVALTVEFLDVSGCTQLTELPDRFHRLWGLNVSGCTGLARLPDGIRIGSWIELAGSGLSELPWSLRSVRLLWKGVPVPDRVVFDPESITVDEIVRERNQAMRSVLLERMRIERFVDEAGAEVLDEDQDAGGARRLLRIATRVDEPIVCVDVRCPSTGKRYLLRVPPDVQECREAIAWTAGYRNPRDYRPVVET